jgi:hypothetical protein
MAKKNRILSFARSFAIHFLLIATAIYFLRHQKLPTADSSIQIALIEKTELPKSENQPAPAKKKSPHQTNLDILRPSFMRGENAFSATPDAAQSSDHPDGLNALLIEPRVAQAFDQLAAQIYRNFDFSDLLFENSVQGNAWLDLYFDREGKVDEVRSRFSGSHYLVRGLLVKATRRGLVDWYRADAYRLKKAEFRNQHLRAELSISYAENVEKLTKTGADAYLLTRKRFRNECLYPGAVDLVCAAMKVKGAVENLINDNSRIQFDLLKDNINHYDDLGLSGINELIQG